MLIPQSSEIGSRAAMRAGIDLIFTNNSAWGGPDGRVRFASFAGDCARTAEQAGGRALLVRVTAPTSVLEARVANEQRREHGKLVDRHRLHELLTEHDPSPLHDTDLCIE